MKNNQRKIGAILSYVSIIASTLVQLLYTPFLISKLGQSEHGLYSLVSSIIGYLTVLDLGFGNAIVVHTAKYKATGDKKKEQKLHGMFHIIYIVIGVIAGIAGVILSLFSDRIFGETMTIEELEKMRVMLLILSFNLFITFAFSIYSSIITANEQFLFQKTMAVINTVAKPLLMIPVLFLGMKSVALCVVITIINIAAVIANYVFCKKKLGVKIRFNGFDKKLFKTIFAYSFWIFLTQIVDKVNWSADQFILGAVASTAVVSVYSAASIINTMFINLSTAISGVMLPKMSKMVAQKASKESLTNEFIKVGRVQFMVILLAVTGLILFGKTFIKLWLGEGYDDTYYVALLLIIPATISLCQNTGLAIMQAMDKFRFKAVITFVMSLINIVISVYLAKRYGAIGAAFGTGLSIVVCNITIMNIYYARVIRLNIVRFWKNILAMLIKYAIPITVMLCVMYFVKLQGVVSLLTYGGTYVIIYAITTYLFVMNNYEKNLLSKFLTKIHLVRRKNA